MDLIGALTRAYDNSRLGHALLFWGRSVPALDFAKQLLCSERDSGQLACGRCDSCKLLALNEAPHPDFLRLTPESETGYTVAAIRSLLEMWHRSHALSPNRVCWIERADLLSVHGGAAANALLKTLEEPRPNSFLLLTTSRPDAVLPTIRSRCQSFHYSVSPETSSEDTQSQEVLKDWEPLRTWLSQGAPTHQLIPPLPADMESFWEDRDAATLELSQVYEGLWPHMSAQMAGERSAEEGLRILHFFKGLESLIFQVRAYGNSLLQWHTLRSDARLGEYGNY